MRIVVAGGSGFLGRALVGAWRGEGHEVRVLTRRPGGPDDVPWAPEAGGTGPWTSAIEGAGAVVNLAGEGIADSRWTAARKAALLDSRVISTRALVAAIRGCSTPPAVLLSASGTGCYGTRGDDPLSEGSSAGSDFLAALCGEWEREAMNAADVARVVLLRTGVVLARDGGALPRMALPFRYFAGGRLGSGRQFISWIHLDDWVGMVRWALLNTAVAGPLNLTAPAPTTNADFTRALARALHRPALFAVPGFVLRVMLGREMADALVLEGQRVLPMKAQQLGFQFRFPDVESALRDIFR